VFLNGITRQTVIGMLKDRQVKVHERHIMPEELEGFRAVLADRHGGRGHPGGPDRRLQFRGRRADPRRGDGYEELVR
jgi:branched-chain amino acid aminotransferase